MALNPHKWTYSPAYYPEWHFDHSKVCGRDIQSAYLTLCCSNWHSFILMGDNTRPHTVRLVKNMLKTEIIQSGQRVLLSKIQSSMCGIHSDDVLQQDQRLRLRDFDITLPKEFNKMSPKFYRQRNRMHGNTGVVLAIRRDHPPY